MKHDIRDGLRYAAWIALVAAAMGGLYGLLGATPWQPMVYTVLLVGTLAMLNALVALLVGLVQLGLWWSGRRPHGVQRYLGLSLGFGIVFGAIFLVVGPFGDMIF